MERTKLINLLLSLNFEVVGHGSTIERIEEHMLRYKQHIDKSLRKHKVFSVAHPFGWKLEEVIPCEEADIYLIKRKATRKKVKRNGKTRNH